MASDAADANAYSAASPVTVVDPVPLESVLRVDCASAYPCARPAKVPATTLRRMACGTFVFRSPLMQGLPWSSDIQPIPFVMSSGSTGERWVSTEPSSKTYEIVSIVPETHDNV